MSNLGNLVKHYRKYIQPGIEHIAPFIRPPWWSTTATVKISPASKDEAAREHQQQLSKISAQDLIIYTDGSGHNGHVGAAIYSPTTRVTRGEYIGTEDTHNVYAAELTAVQMAVALFEEKIEEYANAYIFADNQAAIQAVGSPSRQSGQYIVEDILDTVDRVYRTKPACNIHIEWVPGHKGVEGNEKADQAAKAAAASSPMPTATRMKSAQNRLIQAMVKAQSDAEWKAGKENARHLRSMSQRPGATTGPKLYGALMQRKHVVLVARLRTGHCQLNEYLHRFKVIETPECECGAEKETVKHYLLNCELYDKERDVLRKGVGAQGMRVDTLLGDSQMIRETIKYIEETGRFKFEQG